MAMTYYTLARETPTGATEQPTTTDSQGDYVTAGDVNSPIAQATSTETNLVAQYTYLNLVVCREVSPIGVGSLFYLRAIDADGKAWYIGSNAGYASAAAANTALTGGLLP